MNKIINQSLTSMPLEICNLIYTYASNRVSSSYVIGRDSCGINGFIYTMHNNNIYDDKGCVIKLKNKLSYNHLRSCVLFDNLYFAFCSSYMKGIHHIHFINYYTKHEHKIKITSHYEINIINNKIFCQHDDFIYRYTLLKDFTISDIKIYDNPEILFKAVYNNMLVCTSNNKVLFYNDNMNLQHSILLNTTSNISTMSYIYEENNKLYIKIYDRVAFVIAG